MLAVVSHIVERCGDKRVKQNYKHIVEGTSIVDTLNDCLALAVIIKKYPNFAAEIRPNRVTIDAEYSTAAENRAAELLTRGQEMRSHYELKRSLFFEAPQIVKLPTQNEFTSQIVNLPTK